MQGLYLAMYGDKVGVGQALFISLFAMAVVFMVLLIISYLIDITAFFLKGSAKSKKANGAVSNNTATSAPVTNKKGSDDTVVVIAAAIAAYLGTLVDNVRITKIRRIPQNSTAWSERGLLAQIKPQ